MNNNALKIVLLASTLILFAVALFIFRPNQNKTTRITVVGNSQTKIAPDTAVITFSVITQGTQAVNAQQENARKSEAVKTAIESVALTAKPEIKTNNYNLNPEQDYSGKTPKIAGYEVRNTVTISTNDLSQVGTIIDAATKAGANSVEGIQFVIGETSPAQGEALSLATKQAFAKAEAITKSLNGRIFRVIETREGGAPDLSVNPYDAFGTATSNTMLARTPIQAGNLDVRSQVVLVVEIEI